MKKILVIILSLLVIYSLFIFFFGGKLSDNEITSLDTISFGGIDEGAYMCNGQVRCGDEVECNGSACVMICENNQWSVSQQCQYQCINDECTQGQIGIGKIPEANTGVLDTSGITNPGSSGVAGPSTGNGDCQDGTLHNQCSDNKPYFCSNGNLVQDCNRCGCVQGKECRNNLCVVIGGPYDPDGREDDNPNVLNRLPVVIPISQKIIKVGGNVQFDVRASDPDNDLLIYTIDSPTIANCIIVESKVDCFGASPGEGFLRLKISDGIGETVVNVNIKVLGYMPSLQRGVAAGVANTPPVAEAGPDKVGIAGQKIILDASLSYDREGLLSVPETYKWFEDNNIIGTGKILEKVFTSGTHTINLVVTDSEGETGEDYVNIAIQDKKICKNTPTIYYPGDTICNNKWPVKEGPAFKINSQTDGSCSLFEVCSEELDPIVEESIQCCTGESIDSGKLSVCNFASENSNTLKNCQALYIIKSFGGSAIYMKGYLDAEMCCKGVESLCPNVNYLYTPQPLPDHLNGIKCSNTPENNPNGYWVSDTKIEFNEIALSDVPAHASLNIIKSGTCVDYSVAATTLLRKSGFSADQVMTVEASNHAYNLLRFDLDKKWTIFDMTGNNEGLKMGKVPLGYDYCGSIINCYNDLGKIPCPSNKEIIGCENVKENIGRTTGTVGYKVTGLFKDVFLKIKAEVLR